jgi:hypothetical protein
VQAAVLPNTLPLPVPQPKPLPAAKYKIGELVLALSVKDNVLWKANVRVLLLFRTLFKFPN